MVPLSPEEELLGVQAGWVSHYSGDEEGYNLCTSSDTEWDRLEEHTSFR